MDKEPAFPPVFSHGTMNTQSVLFSALLFGIASAKAAPEATETAFFEKNIRPLLAEHCYKCHSADAEKLKGGLLLDTREGWMNGGDSGEVIEPGNPKGSPLMEAVGYGNPDTKMPPKYKLSDKEIEALHDWIAMGAPDPREKKTSGIAKEAVGKFDIEAGRSFWAFQAPADTAPPSTKDMSWPQSPIDQFVLAPLEARNLKPVADADRRTLLRRVHFDLTGLPPTPEELADFENDAASDRDALAKVVDRLLASPQFGERWGRHWLDIARYAESMGRTRNYPFPFAWRYRDYVIDAFNADKPYDQFVREQIAGDLIEGGGDAEKNERLVATTFLALGSMDLNEKNQEQFRMDQVDEQIDTTGRAILALTTGCARCHNHKFDPISQSDYYALAGIFRSTDTLSGYGSKQGGGNSLAPRSLAALHGAAPVAPPPQPAPPIEQAENRKVRLARQQLSDLQEAMKLLGKAPKAVEAASAKVRELVALPKNQLTARLRETQQEVKRLNKKAGKKGGGGGPGIKGDAPFTMAVRDSENPRDVKLHLRGEIETLGDLVPRGFLEVLRRPDTPEIPAKNSGRLEYAEWISSPENPLTARVMVNRIWQHLFGQGLVRTVDNFGKMGERPSHPELLDFLAIRFVENGWSVKQAIREIVLSHAYRVGSANDPAAFDVDPENRLLWQRNLRRLEVEALRDAMLAASGELDLARPKASAVAQAGNGEIRNQSGRIEETVGDAYRSVYLPVVRSFVPQMLVAFDFAEPSQVIGQRDVTTVSTQALFLLNNEFVIERSDAAARRALSTNVLDENARVALAYEQTLGRRPDTSELAAAGEFLGNLSPGEDKARQAAWSAFYQSLFSSAEFRYVR